MEKKHLILVGFMGSGKSTIGQVLANKLKLTFVDTDRLIEKQQGCSISKIFEQFGEATFRQMETEVLRELLKEEKPLIISTGGGLPLKEENVRILKELGFVIMLDVNKFTVLRRLKKDTTRPLLKGYNVEEKVDKLLTYRREYYEAAADRIVDVNTSSVEQIVNVICSSYKTKGEC